MLEHPEIAWIERTGYPSWIQESDDSSGDNEAVGGNNRANSD